MKLTHILLIFFIVGTVLYPNNDQEVKRFNKGSIGCEINNLTMTIDSRLILLSILQEYSNHWVINRDSSEYLSSIHSFFDKYNNHLAIRLFKSIYENGISEEIPYTFVLSLDYNFKPDTTISNPSYKIIHENLETAKLIVRSIQDFVNESDFYVFFEKSIPFYKNFMEQQISVIEDFNGVAALEEFYGEKHDKYNIIFIPLDYSSKGITITDKYSNNSVYFLSGIGGARNNGVRNKIEFSQFFWHEFGHTFVNHITDENQTLVEKYKSYYDAISEVKNEGYGWWSNALNEQIIRASEVFFTEKYFGVREAEKKLRYEEMINFLYTEGLSNSLKEYYNNINDYKCFKNYFPKLMRSLDTIDISNVRNNIITSLRYFDVDSAIVIIPSDYNNQTRIREFINIYFNKNFKEKNCSMIADTIALKSNLSNHNLIVFGSPSTNKWINKYLDQLPLVVKDSEIISSKSNKGDKLRFVLTWRNPQNNKKDVAICASFDLQNLIGIKDWIPTYAVNYAIFNGDKLIDYGNFFKSGDHWIVE